jgi:hypothetical protein
MLLRDHADVGSRGARRGRGAVDDLHVYAESRQLSSAGRRRELAVDAAWRTFEQGFKV